MKGGHTLSQLKFIKITDGVCLNANPLSFFHFVFSEHEQILL